MIVFRRRLIFWLLKAYIKKWGKVILLSFFAGLFIFFILLSSSSFLINLIPLQEKVSVGVVGAYTPENLPSSVVTKISRGLTKLGPDGSIQPDVATHWKIADSGKTYTFYLNKNIFFSDGQNLTSESVTHDFTDVSVERPSPYEIRYTLKDTYSPFLVTVTRPIFKKGFIGVGEYKLSDVEINGNFIQSLKLVSRKNRFKVETYQFYVSEESLKLAFMLGEIQTVDGLATLVYKKISLTSYPNVTARKKTDYSQLATLFFNTQDAVLSDIAVRRSLTYALPNSFANGERAYVSYPKTSLYSSEEVLERKQDMEHAIALFAASSASDSATFTLKTLSKYRPAAEDILKEWKKLGVETIIEEVDRVPTNFQMYLGDFVLPKDPDQYTIWHSDQINNITKYKNLRIDKLLEDGRKTIDVNERKKIYADFQKYLLDESPAAFLFFPYEYSIQKQ